MDDSTAQSRQPDSMGQAFLWGFLSILLLVLLTASDIAHAQVATNITPSTLPSCPGLCGPGVTIVTAPPTGGTVTTITGGARPGNGLNLFHSFGQFDVSAGDVANFQNTPVNGAFPATSNILSRVTGGSPSQIYGTIQTTDFSGANLFLMNPAGVLFGPSAALDLGAVTGSAVRQPGSFYATTADYLKLVDTNGTTPFYADPAQASVLSVAPVVAFGFLALEPGVTRGTISVQGSMLQVPQGHALSLVGGDITIQAGTLEDSTIQAASLRAPGGQINLVSVASPGEVLVPSFPTGLNINIVPVTSTGTVTLKEGAMLDVSGQLGVDAAGKPIGGNSGTVFVRGGQLVMNASLILANTVGAVDGASPAVDIQVSQDVALTNGAAISVATSGSGRGGDVVIAAGNVHLGVSTITTQTSAGPGRGGDVHITAESLRLENASRIITETLFGDGEGGDLFLNVGKLSLLGGPFGSSQIRSSNFAVGTVVGGDVTVQGTQDAGSAADSSVVLSGGSLIVSETSARGDGGRISITADSVMLSGRSGINSTTRASGNGGKISIRANSLDLNEASVINSSTSGIGTDLNGDGVVDVGGHGGDIVVSVEQLSVVDGAKVSSRTSNGNSLAGAGGTITVQGQGTVSKARSVLLSDINNTGIDTGIFSESASGVPGGITLNAETLTITNDAVISAGSSQSTGPAGNVKITADSIVISADGQIFSRSFAQDSGPVTIMANELTLENGSIVTNTVSESGGHGGDVVLDVGTVSLTNGASINSESGTFSTGRAGNITMNVGSLTLANNAEITSSSKGIVADAGDAGTITITSKGNTVSLASGSSITSTTAGPGDAGQVIITTPTLSLNDATITTSTSSTGNAGGITANVGTLTLTNAAKISSSSTGAATGAAGSVAIQGLASPANAVTITDSSLLTTAENTGQGGSITVNATNLTLNNATISASVKDVPAGGDPKADVGNIALSASAMTMNGSNVTTESSGSRNAGDISINSKSVPGNTFEMWHSTMSTSAALADGGNFGIYATNMVRLTDSIITSSVGNETKTDTLGGNVTIDPQFVILQNSQIRANAFAGSGGAIDIIAGVFLADPASVLSVSSTLGVSGTINIQSPLQNVAGQLTPLSQQFSSAAALLAQQCAARVADGKFSTFVVAGREGLPVEPGGFLASPSLTAELLGASLSGRDRRTQFPAVTEALPEYDARPIQLAMFGNACRQ